MSTRDLSRLSRSRARVASRRSALADRRVIGSPAARGSRPQAGRAAAAAGDGRGGRRPRRHRMGRVHRPARAGAVGRRPAARLGSALERVVRGRQPGPPGTGAVPARRPAVPGAGRAAARRARAGDRRARPRRRRRCGAPNAWPPRTRCRSRSASAAPAPRPRRRRTSMPSRPRCAPRELDLEFTSVVSPIDGRVGRALVTRGNLVSGGQGEATLLTTVVSRRSDLRRVRRRRADVPALRRPRRASTARARRGEPADPDGARRRADLPARGHAAVPRQPARSVDRHDQRPRRLPQPRSPADAGPVRPAAPAGHGRRTTACWSRIAPSAPTSTGASCWWSARDKKVESRTVTLGPLVDGLRVVRNGPDRRRAGRGQRPAARAARRAGQRDGRATMGGAQ